MNTDDTQFGCTTWAAFPSDWYSSYKLKHTQLKTDGSLIALTQFPETTCVLMQLLHSIVFKDASDMVSNYLAFTSFYMIGCYRKKKPKCCSSVIISLSFYVSKSSIGKQSVRTDGPFSFSLTNTRNAGWIGKGGFWCRALISSAPTWVAASVAAV